MIWNMEEISWEADIQVETSPDSPDPNILPEEWSNALECGGHGMEEILMGTEDTYHTTVKGSGKTYHCGGEKVYHRGNA